jgi:hypothetical protein
MNAPTGSVAIAPETFLHLTTTGWTAIGSIVGALSIVALAIFNLLYLRTASAAARAASEQAKAGIDAAEAARKQAELCLKPSLYGRFSLDHLWPLLGDHRGSDSLRISAIAWERSMVSIIFRGRHGGYESHTFGVESQPHH